MPHAVTPSPTPNPNAMRYQFEGNVLGSKSVSFASAEQAAGTPWAAALFQIPGVASLFGVNDFLTVTKAADAAWETITPHVLDVLRDAEIQIPS